MTKLELNIQNYSLPSESQMFFENIQLTLEGGDIVCLLGTSGVGKTSLLRILLGQAEGRLKGDVFYHLGDEILTPALARSRGLVGLFSEDAGLIPWLNVKDNLNIPAELNPKLKPPSERFVYQLLGDARLDPTVLKKKPHQLSIGMAHRVRLVRTLAYSPRFLLLDETFSGLDPVTTSDIASTLKRCVDNSQCCCLQITHDLFTVSRFASKILLMTKERNLAPVLCPISEEDLLAEMKQHS